MKLKLGDVSKPVPPDVLSQRSQYSQRSRTSEKPSIHSVAGRSVASHSSRGIPGVRSRYAVVHLDPAAKLNMTDDQWVQTVKKMQAEGATAEMQKQEKRQKMLKDI